MSYEVFGTPPDPEPRPCVMCDDGESRMDCPLCKAMARAEKAERELSNLKAVLRHRLRILRTRKVYADGGKYNGISVELLQAMTLLQATPGLDLEGVDPRFAAEAEAALLTLENAHLIYPPKKVNQ